MGKVLTGIALFWLSLFLASATVLPLFGIELIKTDLLILAVIALLHLVVWTLYLALEKLLLELFQHQYMSLRDLILASQSKVKSTNQLKQNSTQHLSKAQKSTSDKQHTSQGSSKVLDKALSGTLKRDLAKQLSKQTPSK